MFRAPLRLGNGLRGTDRLSHLGTGSTHLRYTIPLSFFLHLLDARLVTANMKLESASIMPTCGKWELKSGESMCSQLIPNLSSTIFDNTDSASSHNTHQSFEQLLEHEPGV